jgi:hypothetical protein
MHNQWPTPCNASKQSPRFRVWGLGFRVYGVGFGVQGFRVWGLAFRVQGQGFRFMHTQWPTTCNASSETPRF